MRERKEIEKEFRETKWSSHEKLLFLETLLDIRDLLNLKEGEKRE